VAFRGDGPGAAGAIRRLPDPQP